MYDVIGDIHGHFGKLEALLHELGYRVKADAYRHPQGREAVFVGDLIDRGPEQIKVVETVRAMVDAGSAHCILGNHEWNAIAYATLRPDGKGEEAWLRKHNRKNIDQHKEFLQQVGDDSSLHREFIDWFKTLPPFLELDGIRVAHAWWHDEKVNAVAGQFKAGKAINDEFLLKACSKGNPVYEAMEGLTKGLEMRLPEGVSFFDHAGVERFDTRIKWWTPEAQTYREAAVVPDDCAGDALDHLLDKPIPALPDDAVPTFVGHYWLTGKPQIQSARVAVLDYSAAKKGPLVAYRWEGERDLNNGRFVYTGA